MRSVRRRRSLLALLGVALLPCAVGAQRPARPRIGLLIAETRAGQASRFDALRAGLAELGYAEGRNLDFEVRAADGEYDRLPALAADLVRLPVDVLVAFGIKALVAAREATATVPIVIPSTSSDPVAMGLVPRLAGQHSNITGSIAIGPEVMAKRVELLKQILPSLARAAVLVNPANAGFEPVAARLRRSVSALGVTLVVQPASAPENLPAAFDSLAKAGARAVVLQEDTMFAVHARTIADLARRRRLASAGNAAFAGAGGLVGYGASDLALYRRAAHFVDRILKGAKPGEIPIEQATRFELWTNVRTARELGVTIPQPLLLRSDRVVE